MFKTRKQLKKEIASLKEALAKTEEARKKNYDMMMDLHAKLQRQEDQLQRVSVFYTLTDSDFVNYKQETARARAARQRMAMSLGNKIAKCFEPEEVIEDGVLIGYKYSLQVRRAPEYEENPKLVHIPVPIHPKVKALWPDAQRMIDEAEAKWKEEK